MLKILTVLKSSKGSRFHKKKCCDTALHSNHVLKIRDMFKRYLTLEHEFFCLTDILDINCNTIPLEHNWPGWFSKLELFKIKGPVLYVDLDTIILNNLDSYILSLKDEQFCTLPLRWPNIRPCLDSRTPSNHKTNKVMSSIMYWSNDMSFLYEEFLKLPYWEHWSLDERDFRSDQEIINCLLTTRKHNCKWTMLPGFDSDICSYNYLLQKQISNLKRASTEDGVDDKRKRIAISQLKNHMWKNKKIIYFHGDPKPWDQTVIPY